MKQFSLKTEKIKIADREFTLREFTASESERYFQLQLKQLALAVDEAQKVQQDGPVPEDELVRIHDQAASKSFEIWKMILRPDEGELSPEWLAENTSIAMLKEIQKIQEDMSAIEDLWGNLARLVLEKAPAMGAAAQTGSILPGQ